MRDAGIVHQRDARAADTGQVTDLAEMVHAHLDHGIAVLLAQLEQCQRQADVVVQVTLGRQHRILAAGHGAQDAGQHLLHSCLAVAAGDGGQRQVELAAPVGGQCAQRQPRILDQQGRSQSRHLMRDHGGGRTGFQRGGGVIMSVDPLAAHGDEQLSAHIAAAVMGHAGKLRIFAEDGTSGRFCGFG